MNITFKFSTSLELRDLLSRGRDLSGVLERSGQTVADYLRAYHKGITWKGSGWMEPSLGFADKVVAGWQNAVVQGSRVSINNTFGLLAHKFSGGAIYPRRASMLTIPLISAAKGKSVAEYRIESGEPLFRVGHALCQRIGNRVTAIYSLRESVFQLPWPEAMPSDQMLGDAFEAAIELELNRIFAGAGEVALPA